MVQKVTKGEMFTRIKHIYNKLLNKSVERPLPIPIMLKAIVVMINIHEYLNKMMH